MYPRVVVRLDHLRENVKVVRELCEKNHISITGVTKVFRGDPKIAQCYLDGGLTMLGDSRTENLERMQSLPAEKWLIRPPMLSRAAETARYADAALHSEWKVIEAVAAEAEKLGKKHKVILLVLAFVLTLVLVLILVLVLAVLTVVLVLHEDTSFRFAE